MKSQRYDIVTGAMAAPLISNDSVCLLFLIEELKKDISVRPLYDQISELISNKGIELDVDELILELLQAGLLQIEVSK